MAKKRNTVRRDGRIAVQVYIGRDEANKRKYKTVYGVTQKEADEKALQIKIAMRKGLDVSAERDTFGDWAERWLRVKATEVSNGRADSYRNAIAHLNKALGGVQITKIRTADLQDIISSLAERNPTTKKPTGKGTLLIVKGTARQIFDLAISNRVLDYNPALSVKIPQSAPQEHRRALSSEEQGWVLSTPHRAQRAAMIMMYAGLRRGEIVPLTWSDIDLNSRTISVNKAVEEIGGKFIIKPYTKTAAGMRTIDIPSRLADFLREEKRESIYVCVTARKTMHTESSWKRLWESYLTDLNLRYGEFSAFEKRPKSKYAPKHIKLKIPRITPHWLRHTFATILYLSGVDILTAKEQMGHADIKTTLQIYTHLDAVHKRKSMDKLDRYLEDASTMQVTDGQKAT